MKNLPKILLRTYLRRRPIHIRMARFNFLARYGWLKNLLEDLRPELFPPAPPAAAPPEPTETVDAAAIAAHLLDADVRGQQGLYHVERWLGQRGQGQLFAAIQLGPQQPVVLKEFLLSSRRFSPTEARQRQQRFANLAGFTRTDGRRQDIRVIQPIDAIADTQSVERCYLITDARDAAPTLKQHLQQQGAFAPLRVRQILGQVLQSLMHLHQQAVLLPSGQRQWGMVHGNLSLESLLWVDYGPNHASDHPFIYLTDLALWERLFDPPTAPPYSVAVTPAAIAHDLAALGGIARALLTGSPVAAADGSSPAPDLPPNDPYLATFVERLETPAAFASAEAAWQALLQLPHLSAPEKSPSGPAASLHPARPWPRWPVAIAGAALLLVAGAAIWRVLSRNHPPVVARVPVCCLAEVGAIPTGEYVYTSLENGTWTYLLSLENLGHQGQSLMSALQNAHPELQLTHIPATSVEQAIAAVQAGEAEFAVLPRFETLVLPSVLGSEPLAYDGLAVFVAFSYVERDRGLPQALGGELTLQQLAGLYQGNFQTWRELSRAWLPVKRYAPDQPAALHIFEQRVLQPLSLARLPEVTIASPLSMLRTILRDFESQQLSSIGFAPLSQVFGQCSVYPLALRAGTGPAVQPLAFSDGTPITPAVDLCARKGAYFPRAAVFQSGTYPLAYAMMVVFPEDNSRVPVGRKFAELLQTTEGQQLLRAAGLVPLPGATP